MLDKFIHHTMAAKNHAHRYTTKNLYIYTAVCFISRLNWL